MGADQGDVPVGGSAARLHGSQPSHELSDPGEILLGSGNQTHFLRIESGGVLARRDVEALIAAALRLSKTALPASGRGRLIIRSISAKQRPRRKPPK